MLLKALDGEAAASFAEGCVWHCQCTGGDGKVLMAPGSAVSAGDVGLPLAQLLG